MDLFLDVLYVFLKYKDIFIGLCFYPFSSL